MPGMGKRLFSSIKALRFNLGILLLGVKCLRCEVNPSSPSNAEIKKWSIISTPPFAFIPKTPYF
jgi:hypothetical protein